MAEAGSASAAANDASVSATFDTVDGTENLDPVGDAQRNLEAAQAKVIKQRNHLAGAKDAVAEAKRQLAAVEKDEG